jgi:hypothetical protein
MSKEIITVKQCGDCPFRESEISFCHIDESIDFYTSGGGYESFPIGCPLCDGKVFVVCKFWSGDDQN